VKTILKILGPTETKEEEKLQILLFPRLCCCHVDVCRLWLYRCFVVDDLCGMWMPCRQRCDYLGCGYLSMIIVHVDAFTSMLLCAMWMFIVGIDACCWCWSWEVERRITRISFLFLFVDDCRRWSWAEEEDDEEEDEEEEEEEHS